MDLDVDVDVDLDVPPGPRFAARARLQSRLLVAAAVPVLLCLVAASVHRCLAVPGQRALLLSATAVSALFALVVWRLRASTPGGAVSGFAIAFSLAVLGAPPAVPAALAPRPLWSSGLTPLFLLFLLTFAATRLARRRRSLGTGAPPSDREREERRHGRSASQIVANLGCAGVASALCVRAPGAPGVLFAAPALAVAPALAAAPMLAALVEATADTVSSEIGQAFGGQPVSILTLRPAPVGSDGGISLLGTLAGVAAGGLVAASAALALEASLGLVLTALAAGVAGLFFDSLLGATLERRGLLGNDWVNLLSTVFAAALALAMALLLH